MYMVLSGFRRLSDRFSQGRLPIQIKKALRGRALIHPKKEVRL